MHDPLDRSRNRVPERGSMDYTIQRMLKIFFTPEDLSPALFGWYIGITMSVPVSSVLILYLDHSFVLDIDFVIQVFILPQSDYCQAINHGH